MQWIADNLGQVAVIAAVLTLLGVMIKAVTDWLTSSRSKYVDVIAAERIKWVGELRSDFSKFFVGFDRVVHLFRLDQREKIKINDALEVANNHMNLVRLKLNTESDLDITIIDLMQRSAYSARSGDLEEYRSYRSLLLKFCSFLLKDEWEKAKREASGPLRWVWLTWKHWRRVRARAKFVNMASVQAKLDIASRPFSSKELQVLHGEPEAKESS